MASMPQTCVHHPRTPTRLSCSQCDAPICGRCVRPSAVGQRCPKCARPPRGARALGRPEHYVRSVAAGLAVASGGGIAVALLGFGSLILAGLTGFATGRTVNWGSRGQTQSPFPGIAAAVAVAGLVIAFTAVFGTPVPTGGLRLLAYPLAGWFATRGLHR